MRRALFDVNVDAQRNGRAIVQVVGAAQHRLARLLNGLGTGLFQHLAHGVLGVLLDVLHVGLDDIHAHFIHKVRHKGNAALVGRNLRLEIREVVRQLSCAAAPRVLYGQRRQPLA